LTLDRFFETEYTSSGKQVKRLITFDYGIFKFFIIQTKRLSFLTNLLVPKEEPLRKAVF